MSRFQFYLHPIGRMLLFFLFIFLWVLPFSFLQLLPWFETAASSLWIKVYEEATLVVSVGGALLMMFSILNRLDFYSVFVRKKGTWEGLWKGSLWGAILITFLALILWLGGYVKFEAGQIGWVAFVIYLLFFLLVALFEELAFRTYLLYDFAKTYPGWVAILLNGAFFGMVHFFNPGFSWLSWLNISLAGILFAYVTLWKKNVSWAVGLHFTWNFVQGIVLGYSVSGIEMPGILIASVRGNAYLSGGVFGIEGSVACTFLLLASLLFLAVKCPLPQPEEVKDVNEETEE